MTSSDQNHAIASHRDRVGGTLGRRSDNHVRGRRVGIHDVGDSVLVEAEHPGSLVHAISRTHARVTIDLYLQTHG